MTVSRRVDSFAIHQKLVETISFSKQSFVAMGKLLSELKRGDKYREAIGEGINTWVDYIAQPEIGLSKGDADRLIQIYEVFVEHFCFAEEYVASVPVKNLHYLLPIAKRGLTRPGTEGSTEMEELLEDAKVLSQKDFKERIFDVRQEDEDVERTYEFLIMKKCIETGNMSKVHDITSDNIKEYYGLE